MKSEARISPDLIKWAETISKSQIQMFKTLRFWSFEIRICFAFRASNFEFKTDT